MDKMKNRNLYIKIGERLEKVRNIKGYSRKSIAILSHISEKHLYNIEKGKVRIQIDILLELCRCLEISTEYIINGIEDNSVRCLTQRELLIN